MEKWKKQNEEKKRHQKKEKLQAWKTTQNGCKVRFAQGRELFSLGSDLSSRRLCEERNVTVMFALSGCDVTYCATT